MGWHGIAHAPESELFKGAFWTWDGQKSRVAGNGSIAILQPGDDIQQALNDVGAYGVVFLTAGTYTLYNQITINSTGQALIGIGNPWIISSIAMTDTNFILIDNADNVTIKGIEFVDSSLKGISGIKMQSFCQYVRIEDCVLKGELSSGNVGIWVTSGCDISFGQIINNKVHDFRQGIYIGSTGGSNYSRFVVISGNVVRNVVSDPYNSYKRGIVVLTHVSTKVFTIVSNNIVDMISYYGGDGIFTINNGNGVGGAVSIIGNCVQTTITGGSAIAIPHGGSNSGDFYTICNNLCHCPSNAYGIYVSNVDYCVATGNTARGTFSSGYGFAAYGTNAECVLAGNSVQNWTTAGSWSVGYNT